MSEQLTELPAVARNINMFCKKCNVDRYFVVVAHTTATSAKTKCEVCGATKTFKLEAAKKPAKVAKTKFGAKKVTRVKGPTPEELWTSLRDSSKSEAKPYNMKGKFDVDTAIQHPKFGLGFVRVSAIEKIEVAFQEGVRSLVHNRP
jgi:hypothetical protein